VRFGARFLSSIKKEAGKKTKKKKKREKNEEKEKAGKKRRKRKRRKKTKKNAKRAIYYRLPCVKGGGIFPSHRVILERSEGSRWETH